MSERPQAVVERAAPDEWLKRFEVFRERFRLGLIDENKFKEIARAFQFTDDLGHIWMPGATSQQWYRWDRTKWTAAPPPRELIAAKMPVAIALTWNRALVAPIELKAPSSQLSAAPPPPEPARTVSEIPVAPPNRNELPPLEVKPAPVVSAPPPPSMSELSRARCPHCGESYIAPAKFCPHCGNLIAGAAKKSGRPTDLPEQGPTRPRSKPTDLPR